MFQGSELEKWFKLLKTNLLELILFKDLKLITWQKNKSIRSAGWIEETPKISIDTEIQIIYGLLNGEAGSISVMDIYTGEIVAMNSSPSFNPNDFVWNWLKKWKDLNQNPFKPLINKTISGLYSLV